MAANVLLDAWTTMCLAHPGDVPNKGQTTSLLRAAGEVDCAQHKQLPFVERHMHKLAPPGEMFRESLSSCTAGPSRLLCESCKTTFTYTRQE